MRVDAGSCGKGDGCVTGSDAEDDADREDDDTSVDEVLEAPACWVLVAMPKSAVVVAESTRSGVARFRRAIRAGWEQEVMNIVV